jgi:carbon-monoxide dehydrogenase medium subunit
LIICVLFVFEMGTYYTATSVEDAYSRLQKSDGYGELIADGQTLILHRRGEIKDSNLLVDISDIDALAGIEDVGGAVRIGSTVTYGDLETSQLIWEEFPYFSAAIDQISGSQVRRQGMLGDGLCYGDPALGSLPVLLTLDTEVSYHGHDGDHTIPLTEFHTDDYATSLESGEILTHITISKLPPRSAGKYQSITLQQGDCAVAGVAVRLTLDRDGTCDQARIGLTNAGEMAIRARLVEDALEGEAVTRNRIDEAVGLLDEDLHLLEDERPPRSYKETVFKRLVRKTIADVDKSLTEDTDD